MRIVTIAALGCTAAALIAMAPALASSIKPHFDQVGSLVRVDNGWRTNPADTGCVLKRTWKIDYAGKPYLKKVRVCA